MLHKIFVKLLGLIGYKLFDKNLIKNQRLIDNNSVHNMSFFLDLIFKKNKIDTLIQVGANDGIRFDELKKYIKTKDIKSILIEPVKDYYDKLKDTYSENSNVFFENCAITESKGEINIYKVNKDFINIYDDHVRGINSLDRNHLIKHKIKPKHISLEKVKCMSMYDIILKHNISKLDLVYVDAEGHDGNIVINLLEFTEQKPIIIFEFIHIEHNIFKILINRLNENGYKFFKINENIICLTEDKEIL